MAFSGDLESFSLTDVFQKVQQNQDTGRLLVDDGKRPFHVYFAEGKVRGVKPVSGDDPYLGGVLKRRGGVSADRLKKIFKRASKDGPIMAAWRAGALTESKASELLAFYCSERVFDLFAVDQGSFTFEEGEPALQDLPAGQKKFEVELDPGKLLFEAARRADEWKRIKKRILSSSDVFVPDEKKKKSESPADLPEEEKAVLDLLDGSRTASDVSALSPESRFTVFKALSGLLSKGLVRPLSPEDATSTARRLLDEGQYEEAIRVGRKGLETERNRPELRKIVAEALIKKGEKQKAAGELKLLAYSFADSGNVSGAENLYREVVELVPRDFDARERLFEMVAGAGSLTKILSEGKAFAEAAKKYGALDRAQDILERVTSLAPASPTVLASLADIHERSGNREEAVVLLRRAAENLYEEGRFDEAKKTFERVLFLTPDDVKAKSRIEEIRSGQAEKKARFRRVLLRLVLVSVIAGLVLAWGVWDWVSQMSLNDLTVRTAPLLYEGRYNQAQNEALAFAEAHPFTLASRRARRYADEIEVLKTLEGARESLDLGNEKKARDLTAKAYKKALDRLPHTSETFRLAEKAHKARGEE